MKLITFERQLHIPQSANYIGVEISNIERWTAFDGYGPLPGIERAEYETRTENFVGSRVRVPNRDDSSHIEEFLAWDTDCFPRAIVTHLAQMASET